MVKLTDKESGSKSKALPNASDKDTKNKKRERHGSKANGGAGPKEPNHQGKKGMKRKRPKDKEEDEEDPEVLSEDEMLASVDPLVLAKYSRGDGVDVSEIKDKKHKQNVGRFEKQAKVAQARAAAAELLLPEDAGFVEAEGMESTHKFKQKDLLEAVDLKAAKSIFNLSLPNLGPYCIDYTKNGRWLVLGGKKGHLAMMDALRMDVQFEVQLGETIRDVCCLHNEGFVAVAQRKYVYMYDSQGAEVHCLRQHLEPHKLAFLPYHFLLASVGRTGYLKYHDISTGTLVAEHRTKLGSCDVMRANPRNAIMHLGHANGVVTMWSPTMAKPLVRMLTHRGPVTSLAIDVMGEHMVTAGSDGQVKVWDLRTYKVLHAYFSPAATTSMDISQRGLLALGYGSHVAVWRDALTTKAKTPYLRHSFPAGHEESICRLRFRPFEDALGVGHAGGYSTLLVPGAGEPNFDTFEANPFQNSKQRREAEVKALLDKLQPETIALDPTFVGTVDADPAELQKEVRALAADADTRKKEVKVKNKARGRNKIAKKLQKKQANVVDAGVMKYREKLAEDKAKAREEKETQARSKALQDTPSVLQRFM